MARDDPDFCEFFAGEFWPLRRVGFLLTGDWDQAEDLAQDAMARTYAVWPRVRGYDRPAAYARKVLLNPTYAGERLAGNTTTEAGP
jgi:DNA-directed RNA polymerase specialized sigma24 family protein